MWRRSLLALMLTLAVRGEVLTLERAVEQALASNPELGAERAARQAAPFQLQAARALPVPEFRMSFTNLSVDPELADSRNIAAWRWAPPRPNEISLKIRMAKAMAGQTEADIRLAELRLSAKVRNLYRRATLSTERAKLAAQVAALRREILEVTRRQIALGLKESPEADLAALALADAENEEHARQSEERLARLRLGHLVYRAGHAEDYSLEPPPASPPKVDRAALSDHALRSRGELRRAESACDRTKSALALARNQTYPWISGIQVTRRFGTDLTARAPWGIQAGVDLPFYRSAAKAEAGLAKAAAERCVLEERSVRQRVSREVEEAAARMESAIAELARIESMTLGPARRLLDSTRQALAAGRADRIDVLLAEVRGFTLRDRLLARRLELADIEMELDLAAGY